MANSFKDRIINAFPVFSGLFKNQNLFATTVVAGAAAGDLTVSGVKNRDDVVSVVALPEQAQALVSGGAAGDITVTGITTDDNLLMVLNVTDAADLTSEFSITAADTINNTAGTATTGDLLLVIWERPYVVLTSEFSVVGDNTINNAGGTASTGRNVMVSYMMWEER